MRREVLLPDPGEGLTEATIIQWRVGVGDAVVTNQLVVEIETAKSAVELPSPWDGTVAELLVPEGMEVPVGTPILAIEMVAALVGETAGETPAASAVAEAIRPAPLEGEASAAAEADEGAGPILVGYGVAGPRRSARRSGAAAEVPANAAAVGGTVSASSIPNGAVPSSISARPGKRVLAKPPVRKLAKDLGIDLTTVAATGPGGTVSRDDVTAADRARQLALTTATVPAVNSSAVAAVGGVGASQPAAGPGNVSVASGGGAAPAGLATGTSAAWLAGGRLDPAGRATRVPVRSVRRHTAAAMVKSAFTAPHVTLFQTVDITKTMQLVAQLRASREFAQLRVSPLLMVMKALILAVRKYPEVNASWDESAQEIVYKHYVNLGIAAATARGLVVPNIKDAEQLSVPELSAALTELTATARAGTTSLADLSQGTITITNIGVFGVDTGTPILNPGEAAILAFGAIKQQPWVHEGEITVRDVTTLAMSFDHRLVDGELGCRVLAEVAALLADPARAFLR